MSLASSIAFGDEFLRILEHIDTPVPTTAKSKMKQIRLALDNYYPPRGWCRAASSRDNQRASVTGLSPAETVVIWAIGLWALPLHSCSCEAKCASRWLVGNVGHCQMSCGCGTPSQYRLDGQHRQRLNTLGGRDEASHVDGLRNSPILCKASQGLYVRQE